MTKGGHTYVHLRSMRGQIQQPLHMHWYAVVGLPTYTWLHATLRTYLHTNLCMYMYVSTCTYVHTYVRMFVITYVHMYVRTYMYVCMYKLVR